MTGEKLLEFSFRKLLSSETKERVEKFILIFAIISYLLHLLVIFLNIQGFIDLEQNFFRHPIAAIYTPFSFILLFEVYLLVYYLPKSTTKYISKQYEIITLIVIRRIFKDIAYVELSSDWFKDKYDLQFTFDAATALILFFLIYLFYQRNEKRSLQKRKDTQDQGLNVKQFIQLKKALATILVPILGVLALYTFVVWVTASLSDYENTYTAFKKLNTVFYDEFFTLLIIVDVLLLLSSFFYSDRFYKIIRNSGFVISTILIRISFLAEGIINNFLIIGAVLFGYLILIIHNLYEKDEIPSDEQRNIKM